MAYGHIQSLFSKKKSPENTYLFLCHQEQVPGYKDELAAECKIIFQS